jgi:midasin (ATPase involved in ribosome maturation)
MIEFPPEVESPEWESYPRALPKAPVRTIYGVEFPWNPVPTEMCLPYPEGYELPTRGQAKESLEKVTVAVKSGRSIWLSGTPGVGKDAYFSWLSAYTRTPGKVFQVIPGQDLQAWRFTRSFNAEGATWEDGELLRYLRDGFTHKGVTYPYMIVLSDLDRATKSQFEELRTIVDSIQGRVAGAQGRMFPVLPGTVIAATANSTGSGDPSGRCISSNTVDSSIMDRFERKFILPPLDWEDEKKVLARKFPKASSYLTVDTWAKVHQIVMKLRGAVTSGEIQTEFTHRTMCSWFGDVEDHLSVRGKITGFCDHLQTVLDGMPDPETREKVSQTINLHLF